MLRHAEQLLAGLSATIVPDDAVAELRLDANRPSLPGQLTALVGTINLRCVDTAEGALLLHAGALCRDDGSAVLACGASGSGKSTLTATLAARGAAYLTDEMACLDAATLRVSPYRKPLALKPGSHAVFPHLAPEKGSVAERCTGEQWLVPPDRLGAPPPPQQPIVPRLLVFPTFAAGEPVQLEPVEPAQAAYLLGGNSVRLQRVIGGGLPALARLVRRAPAYRLRHGDVEAAADAVEALWEAA